MSIITSSNIVPHLKCSHLLAHFGLDIDFIGRCRQQVLVQDDKEGLELLVSV